MIKCPVCHDLMMVLEADQIEIDYCVVCQGIWLDEGELELLLEGAGQKDRFFQSFKKEIKSAEKTKRCPICRKKMDKISFLPGSGTGASAQPELSTGMQGNRMVVDGCPLKHGIWFDRGELLQALAGGGLPEDHEICRLLAQVFLEPIHE